MLGNILRNLGVDQMVDALASFHTLAYVGGAMGHVIHSDNSYFTR